MTSGVELGFMPSTLEVCVAQGPRLFRLLTLIALHEYHRRVNVQATHLENRIAALTASNGFVNFTQLCHWFSVDVMGDLIFSKSFHMLEKGEAHPIAGLLSDSLDIIGVLSPVPWLMRIGMDLLVSHPVVKKWHRLVKPSRELMIGRKEV
ncbi:MAG: hypothetical protein Q9170_007635 [Blastenia crenularia]